MNAPIANAAILVRTTLMPGRGSGALVRPHREHRGAESAGAQLRHADAERDEDTEHEEAERESRVAGARPDRQVEPEERRAGDVLALDRHQVDVAEPHRFERDRERQRDHRDGQAADAHRGEREHDADHHRGGRGDDRRERERHVPVGGQRPEEEAGDSGERELRERDLAGEAGDDDLRRAPASRR